MKEITISDVTMKQTGKDVTLSFKEKIELSKLLSRLNVSVIELSAIENPKIDSLLMKSVAMAVKGSKVAVPVSLNPESVELTWNALKGAASPRLQVEAPVSPVQMEYLSRKKPAAMLKAIRETVEACCACCGDVEFIADDATRADPEFLYEAIGTAISAGAGTVTVCDTAGAMLADEFTAFLKALSEYVPALSSVRFGVSCSNALSMADSCAIAAIHCGAVEVKCSAYAQDGISLPNIARILAAKGGRCGVACGIRMTELNRTISQIVRMCQSSRSKLSPFDHGVQDGEDGLCLSSHDDCEAVKKAVERLGYDLSEEDSVKVFEAFSKIAAKKEQVGYKELDAIVASAALQVPPTYVLESYMVNASNVITATAHIKMVKQGTAQEGISVGDGPIDASFLALEQITGRHYELDDFQIQAVTEGREAMGQTVVKLRSGGKLYSGRGISTDILGASIAAYVNALNKIVYEEEAV